MLLVITPDSEVVQDKLDTGNPSYSSSSSSSSSSTNSDKRRFLLRGLLRRIRSLWGTVTLPRRRYWSNTAWSVASPSVSFSSLFPGEGVGAGVLESYTATACLAPSRLTKKGKPRKVKLWEKEGPAAERARKVRENRERKKKEKADLQERYESLVRENQEAERDMAALSGEITASEERQSALQSALNTKKVEFQRFRSHMGNFLMELEKVSRDMGPSYTQEVARNLCHGMRCDFVSHSGLTGPIPTSCTTYGQREEDSTGLFFA
ncbi:uncharacterized protein LOC143024417 [Oratosquilla oratoria]|uniref:uncharacterized protein LOC143024417 n=1 Tax=Oratosquilla oratoria TaxID=337810 RepID=UPI003F75B230